MFTTGLIATGWSSENEDNAPLNSEEKLLSLGAIDDLFEVAQNQRKKRDLGASSISPKRGREVKKARKVVPS
jgi:hypothetical protein